MASQIEELPQLPQPPDHELRMTQARRRAEWELGDASWADDIIGAYLYPAEDARALRLEKEST